MYSSTNSVALVGVEPRRVGVEAHITRGKSHVLIVGLPDTAVREARDRVVAAMASSGFNRPPGRVVVNLTPADLPKAGSAYDLPIALAVLSAMKKLPPVDDIVALGELGLDGSVHPARGSLAAGLVGRDHGWRVLVNENGAAEAAIVRGSRLMPVRSLSHAIAVVEGSARPSPVPAMPSTPSEEHFDLSQVRGHATAVRALEIAAAGAHHFLMWGPPGTGKTMLAKALAGILPPLTDEESLDVAQVFAAAGRSAPPSGMRPFRSPHHSATLPALVGGGSGVPAPGEISLAHHGVLFLDELGEFPSSILEGLRQPIEDGTVTIARQGNATTFPARFQMVAATNPCPCGFSGDRKLSCTCSRAAVEKYRRRLSGPLIDRFDVRVRVGRPSRTALSAPSESTSAEVAARVEAAVKRQDARGGRNGALQRPQLDQLEITGPAHDVLGRAYDTMTLSARGYDRIRRVARTIADLDESDPMTEEHVTEALTLRGAW